MPALVAARFNPDLKAKYQQLIAIGKPAKVTITAVMRKLVVTANALLKADRRTAQGRPPPASVTRLTITNTLAGPLGFYSARTEAQGGSCLPFRSPCGADG